MNNITFPRLRHRRITVIVTGVAAVLFLVGYMFPTMARTTSVHTYQRIVAENHLWSMVAGVEPIDDSSNLGELARVARSINQKADPVTGYRSFYFPEYHFNTASDQIDTKVYGNKPYSSSSDYTHLGADFALSAIQASNPDNLSRLLRPLPEVSDYWLLNWPTVGYGFLLIFALGGLFWLYQTVSAERAYVRRLPKEAAWAYRLWHKLDREPLQTTESARLMTQLANFFNRAKYGYGMSAASMKLIRDEFQDLQAQFDGAVDFLATAP